MYDLAYQRRSKSKVVAYLTAYYKHETKANASNLLTQLLPLKLSAHLVPNTPSRSASQRRALYKIISSSSTHQNANLIVIFTIKNYGDCITPVPRVQVDAFGKQKEPTLLSQSTGLHLIDIYSDKNIYTYRTSEDIKSGLTFAVNNEELYKQCNSLSCCTIS